MATVYRKIITRKLPTGAEIFTRKGERLAKWKDRKGRKRTAPLTSGRDGSDRITVQAGTYTAKYCDGHLNGESCRQDDTQHGGGCLIKKLFSK